MRVSIIQSKLSWENPVANRAMFSQKLGPLRDFTDLVVLPEMFTTGFSMNADALAEPMDGPTMQWFQQTAIKLDAAIAGSFICRENDRFYNRLIFMRPGGDFDFYDKKHLFSLAGEHEYYTAGNKQLVVEWMGWRIRPLVCYDLRFPVWSAPPGPPGGGEMSSPPVFIRKDTEATPSPPPGGPGGAELLLYVANWPSRRAHHWRTLLMARAIENQAFVIGVNIFGQDGNGLEYTGDSVVVDFSGQAITQISGGEDIATAELSLDELQQYRRQLPFLQDGDVFQLC